MDNLSQFVWDSPDFNTRSPISSEQVGMADHPKTYLMLYKSLRSTDTHTMYAASKDYYINILERNNMATHKAGQVTK